MTQISEHFTLAEFLRSETAARYCMDNTPSEAALANLARLAAVLEVCRGILNRPLQILSGYRSPALNAAVRGAKNSAHMDGCAADLAAPGLTPFQTARMLRTSKVDYDQLILEGSGASGEGWVHLGIAKQGETPRREALTARFTADGPVYAAGILVRVP